MMKKRIYFLLAAVLGSGCATTKPESLTNEQKQTIAEIRIQLSKGVTFTLDDLILRMDHPPLYAPNEAEKKQMKEQPYFQRAFVPVFASGHSEQDLLDERIDIYSMVRIVAQDGLTIDYTVYFIFIYVKENIVIGISSSTQNLADFNKIWHMLR